MSSRYNATFFARHQAGSSASARAVLPVVLDLVRPQTAIDVGCGTGGWVRVMLDRGVDAYGIDGDYVDRAQLEIPVGRFRGCDLSRSFDVEARYDLALSLEVAEHLPPSSSNQFVRQMTMLAPVVLFSAAVPFQGGDGHINERSQTFWAEQFAAEGYDAFDVVRPILWNDETVRPWYLQNVLLYVEPDRAKRLGLGDDDRPLIVDLVHPRLLERKIATPELREVLRMLPVALRRRLTR
jgi:SAM-dependent methyltransferase